MPRPRPLRGHIAQREEQKETQFSSLLAHDSTLDGINFRAVDAAKLVRELEKPRMNGAIAPWPACGRTPTTGRSPCRLGRR
jgi:hypothetical protein